MPRSHPAKPLTILLPPLPASSSGPSSPSASALTSIARSTPAPAPAPSLDVLLLARKLAAEKGQVLDVESFMSPEQKNEYYTTILHRSPPPSPKPRKRPSVTELSDIGSPATPDGQTPSHTPKKPKMPNLSHLHWRQRQKKLAEWAKAAEAAESGEVATPTSPPATEVKEEKEKAKKGDADAASLQSSASYWNHLLIQARQERGPQWDYHSQSYHVDQHSKTYYNHGKEPRQDPEPEPKVKAESTPAAAANTLPPSNTPSSATAPGAPLPLTNGIQANGHGPSPSPAASTPHRRSSDISASAPPHSLPVNPSPSPHAAQPHHLPPTPHQQPTTPHNPHQALQSPHHASTPAHTQPPLSTPQPQAPGSGQFQQRLPPHVQAQFAAAQAGSGSPAGAGGFRTPGNPPMGLTPQQLAQLSQLSQSGSSNGSIQAAMAQLARQGQGQQGSSAQNMPAHTQPGGLNPAQLSNFGNMGQFNQPGMSGQSPGQMPGGINLSQLGGQGGQQSTPLGFNMSSVGSNGMTPGRSQSGQGPMLGAAINWQEFTS